LVELFGAFDVNLCGVAAKSPKGRI